MTMPKPKMMLRLLSRADQVSVQAFPRTPGLLIGSVDTKLLQPPIHLPQAVHHTLTPRVAVTFQRKKHQSAQGSVSFQSRIEPLRLPPNSTPSSPQYNFRNTNMSWLTRSN